MQEDYFETEESIDIDNEDIIELISKTELSASQWDVEDVVVEGVGDVCLLQEIIKQKDAKLMLSAEIGSKLLLTQAKLSQLNNNLESQVYFLKDEVNQLKHEKKSLKMRSGEEEEMMRTTLQRSNSLKAETTNKWRHQVKTLRTDMALLSDEFNSLQLCVQEQIDEVRRDFKGELQTTMKQITVLERRVEWAVCRHVSFDADALTLKKSIQSLAVKCHLQEVDIETLNFQLRKIKESKEEEKIVVGQLVGENESLKRMVGGLKDRVQAMQKCRQPKVLRHVNDRSSPYIDSQSLAHEMDTSPLNNRFLKPKKLSLQPDSFYDNYYTAKNNILNSCVNQNNNNIPFDADDNNTNSNSLNVNNNNHGNISIVLNHSNENDTLSTTESDILMRGFRRFIGWDFTRLGQPGRVGSKDLEIAVNTLAFKNKIFKSYSIKNIRKLHESHMHKGIWLRNDEMVSMTTQNKPINESIDEKPKIKNENYCGKYFEGIPTNDQASSSFNTAAVRKSRLIQEWADLWSCNISDALSKKSGVWIKGSNYNDRFIEEDFADFEMDEDNYTGVPNISSTTNHPFLLTNALSNTNISNDSGLGLDTDNSHVVDSIITRNLLSDFNNSKSNKPSLSTSNLCGASFQRELYITALTTANDMTISTFTTSDNINCNSSKNEFNNNENNFYVEQNKYVNRRETKSSKVHRGKIRKCKKEFSNHVKSPPRRNHSMNPSLISLNKHHHDHFNHYHHSASPLSFSMDDLRVLLPQPPSISKFSSTANFLNDPPSTNFLNDSSIDQIKINCFKHLRCDKMAL